MILIISLIISVTLNVLLIWYLRKVLEKLMFVSDTIGGLFDSVEAYQTHIQSMYELETYYGEDTLQSLITHTKELYEELEQFEGVYSLTDTEEEYVEGEEEYDTDPEEAS